MKLHKINEADYERAHRNRSCALSGLRPYGIFRRFNGRIYRQFSVTLIRLCSLCVGSIDPHASPLRFSSQAGTAGHEPAESASPLLRPFFLWF